MDMTKIYYNKYVIDTPQTNFYIEKSYIPHSKSLFVYYNGLLLAANDDYTEVDEHNIELNFRAYKGDVIVISPLAVPDGITQRKNMKQHIAYDEFEIKTRQSEFKLTNKYVPGANAINVYYNGMLLSTDKYIEVDSETIRILARLEAGDRIVVKPRILVGKNISFLKKDIINRNKWNKYDEFIVKEEEREFTLSAPYVPGTNAIKVYFNGVLLDTESYMETSDTTIALKFFPEPNDIVVVAPVVDTNAMISSVNGDIVGGKPGCMFYRYGVNDTLKPNQKYELKLFYDGKEKTFSFNSLYSPFYTTAKVIRGDLHEIAEELTDDRINFTIWQNSKEIAVKYEETWDDLVKDKMASAKNWVRYKTEIDLINAVYINIASRAGSTQKTLGNMQVSKSVKIPYLDEMIKLIQRKLNAEENRLSGVGTVGKAMRKANKTDYPISPDRRSF